jgi:hypothetical protein
MHGVNEKCVQNFCPKETLRRMVGKAESTSNWEDDTGGDIGRMILEEILKNRA